MGKENDAEKGEPPPMNTLRFLASKLKHRHLLKRLLIERACEPIHLNLLSAPIALFGTFSAKVAWDLVFRQPYAFGLLKAAEWAKEYGAKEMSALEFGVATGTGLLNLCELAKKVARVTGVKIKIYGFDSGSGLPKPVDYRDHPEGWQEGDFPMHEQALIAKLPDYAQLILGDISHTVETFQGPPIGFISIDVDYYSSAIAALKIFSNDWSMYLPWVLMYFDDVVGDRANPSCGELAAIQDFNRESPSRRIYPANGLRASRIFQRTRWIDQMYVAHILDHEYRSVVRHEKRDQLELENPLI